MHGARTKKRLRIRMNLGTQPLVILGSIPSRRRIYWMPRSRKRFCQFHADCRVSATPKKANRSVSIERLNRTSRGYYEMGEFNCREALIMYHTTAKADS